MPRGSRGNSRDRYIDKGHQNDASGNTFDPDLPSRTLPTKGSRNTRGEIDKGDHERRASGNTGNAVIPERKIVLCVKVPPEVKELLRRASRVTGKQQGFVLLEALSIYLSSRRHSVTLAHVKREYPWVYDVLRELRGERVINLGRYGYGMTRALRRQQLKHGSILDRDAQARFGVTGLMVLENLEDQGTVFASYDSLIEHPSLKKMDYSRLHPREEDMK